MRKENRREDEKEEYERRDREKRDEGSGTFPSFFSDRRIGKGTGNKV